MLVISVHGSKIVNNPNRNAVKICIIVCFLSKKIVQNYKIIFIYANFFVPLHSLCGKELVFIRNMRISTRIMILILMSVLAVFLFTYIMSVRYVHTSLEQRQRQELTMRAEYIQAYLRSLYYWDIELTSAQAQGLSIDLRDLSYDMHQDVHVYSLSGELLATSSQELLDKGLLPMNMLYFL